MPSNSPPMTTGRVVPPSRVGAVLQRIRRHKKVVFTNGCFDLVHAGHLKVLRHAKRQGDVLVVGLNSDASVRRLKGRDRPILPLRERAALLAALRCVDFVTWFHEDTPLRLIQHVRPDVLVKGGDWKTADVVGREYAGRTVRVPLVKGRSTTAIVRAIRRRNGAAPPPAP